MNRLTSTRGWPIRTAGLLLLAGLLLWGLPAAAQAIKVTSAVPDVTDQGTVGLVVTIGGENFAKGAKVEFFVTGTTNPGGIAVKNVKYKNSKTLEATIDVAPDAQTELKFDIQVMSNGRTGKGTELFKVNVKVTGGDLTPPGTVKDLRAVEIGFNTALINWTAPADDGYLPSSGPALKYEIRFRACGPYTAEIWGSNDMTAVHDDPCFVWRASPNSGMPGSTEAYKANYLSPVTQYWAMVRTVDDAPQGGNWSDMALDLQNQHSFTTGAFPATTWNADIVDWCPEVSWPCWVRPPRFDFGADGLPTMLYRKDEIPTLAAWTGGIWLTEQLPIAIDAGNYFYDFAFDPAGAATISTVVSGELRFYRRTGTAWQSEVVARGSIGVNSLAYDPVNSVPTIAYRYTKGSGSTLRLAERRGSWSSQDVASRVVSTGRLAFAADGDPAVAFIQEVTGGHGLAFALRHGSVWSVGLAESKPGASWTSMDDVAVAFDPSRGDFAVAGVYRDASNTGNNLVRFCERTSGVWACLTVAQGDFIWGVSLGIAPDGTVYVAYPVPATLYVAVRRPGAAWTTEYADWNYWLSSPDLHIGPDGQPAIAYRSANGPTGAGGSDGNGAVSFARRSPQ